jgi:hypothetical protein
MRFVIPAAALALLATPVLAQAPATTAPATPAPAITAPATPAPTTPAAKPAAPQHHHMTFNERFKAANTTNDGHLTLDQAKAAKWTYVERHFTAMDKDKKGYVTADDIHAYAHASHATTSSHPAKPKTPATPAPTTAPATSG